MTKCEGLSVEMTRTVVGRNGKRVCLGQDDRSEGCGQNGRWGVGQGDRGEAIGQLALKADNLAHTVDFLFIYILRGGFYEKFCFILHY